MRYFNIPEKCFPGPSGLTWAFGGLAFDIDDAQIDWESLMKDGVAANGLGYRQHTISMDHLKARVWSLFLRAGPFQPKGILPASTTIKFEMQVTLEID